MQLDRVSSMRRSQGLLARDWGENPHVVSLVWLFKALLLGEGVEAIVL